MVDLEDLISDVRNCKICAKYLPFEPNPVVRLGADTQILVIGQAPGQQAHLKTLNWDDQSGNRLRNWLNVTRELFYNNEYFSLMSMGFCFPGTSPKGGDLGPRPECAPKWHDQIMKFLPKVEIILLVGRYAQQYYLPDHKKITSTELIKLWTNNVVNLNSSSGQKYQFIPLPHPSWRSNNWIAKNPWFEVDTIPKVRERIHTIISS